MYFEAKFKKSVKLATIERQQITNIKLTIWEQQKGKNSNKSMRLMLILIHNHFVAS